MQKEKLMDTLLLLELLAISSLATLNIIRMITIARNQSVVKTGVNEWTNVDASISGAETYDDMLVDHFRRDHQDRPDLLERGYWKRLDMNHAKKLPIRACLFV